jgi:curved DNA-binding protein CbpA
MQLERDAYEVLQVSPRAHADVVRAAYRALAGLFHPDRDGSEASMHRMAEINAAYAAVRTVDRRAAYDALRNKSTMTAVPVVPVVQVVTPPRPPVARADRDPGIVDFGRYAGWTIDQLARQDPDYLRWLSRHSSGIRYRKRISEVLAVADRKQPTASQRTRGRS